MQKKLSGGLRENNPVTKTLHKHTAVTKTIFWKSEKRSKSQIEYC
jgi:hypothetical protein